MTNSLSDDLCAALDQSNWSEATRIGRALQEEDAFAYAGLRDTLHALEIATEDQRTELDGGQHRRYRNFRPEAAGDVVRARLDSLQHWNREGNQTIQAIAEGTLEPELIKPHPRKAPEEYAAIYAKQNAERAACRAKAPRKAPKAQADPPNARQLPMGDNVNHAVRTPMAATTVELVFGLVQKLARPEKISWIDIACGAGEIANSVNPARFHANAWQIVGSDLQEAKIADARSNAARDREFVAEDAFEMLRHRAAQGQRFEIVSMFEFLEHIDDPLGFLRQVASFDPMFVVAGSPLEQKIHHPNDTVPDPVHLWSYSRKGWEIMFEKAGLTPVISSEVRVGYYLGGLDWLTMVAGPKAVLKEHRTSLGRAIGATGEKA